MVYTLPNENITTIEEILVYESQQIPILWPMILFMIFVVFAGSAYIFQTKKDKGNLSLAMAASGLITSTLAFILFLMPGMINLETLAITITLTILFAFWALFDSNS